jgi:hypothetical protein
MASGAGIRNLFMDIRRALIQEYLKGPSASNYNKNAILSCVYPY